MHFDVSMMRESDGLPIPRQPLLSRNWLAGLAFALCTWVVPASAQEIIQGPIISGQIIQGTPIQGVPIQGTPIQGVPIQGVPIQGVPAQGQIIQGAPVQGVPVNPAPVVNPPRIQNPALLTQPNPTSQKAPGKTAHSSLPQTPASGTEVPLLTSLTSLLNNGGVPKSIEQLKALEIQQRKVARSAIASTVSVKIGPAQGCGVIITGEGHIFTAAHVAMRPKKTAIITLSDGRNVTATTMGMNRNVDAGLIKINPGQNGGRPWPHASLGTSENLTPGMWCIATGHPGGYDISRGMVTRVGRILQVKDDSIVTDCALIGGDSGGPLFDIAGRLIAVHSRIGNDVADNLHVQIDHYDYSWKRLVRQQAWGYLKGFKPVLGVRAAPNSKVAKISIVKSGSPAAKAGLKPGDIVEQFGDVSVSTFASLQSAVSDTMPGERVPVWLRRGNDRLRLIVEIGRQED